MKLIIVLIVTIAAVQGLGPWKGGLSVRFGINPLTFRRNSFINMPRSVSEAKNARWVETSRPKGPLPSLVMFCPSNTDRVVCTMYDDTEYIAGLQVALPTDRYNTSNSGMDWETLGFTLWTPPVSSGSLRSYWTSQQYYIDEVTLDKSAAERIAARNSEKTIQGDYIWVAGFGGKRMAIPTDGKAIADSATSHYTRQACFVLMGRHYYYNMTALTPCDSNSILPWYPLVHSDELIGVGFYSFGKLNSQDLVRDYFERPTRLYAEMIIPNAPQCFYELAGSAGRVSMHTYFVDAPWLINCIGQ